MKKVGLTGNIGSGKSTVCKLFRVLGIPVFHADVEAKKLLNEKPVKDLIVSLFGTRILNQAGEIDRKSLATVVFNDARKLDSLNKIIHPEVMERFFEWVNLQQSPFVVMESAILFEQSLEGQFDQIVHVSCPEEIAIERVMRRDNASREAVTLRIKSQWSDQCKASKAGFVIINDDSKPLIPQVIEIHRKLSVKQ